MKKSISLLLAAVVCVSLCACGQSAALKDFEALVGQIGSVTLESESAIIAAEEAYAALTEEEKADAVESAVQLTQSRKTYDELVKTEETIALIDAIGTVSLDSGSAISAAKSAYNELSADSKSQVTNYSVLETAEEEYNTIRAAEKDRIIQEYMPKFDTVEDKVNRSIGYFHKTIPQYIDTRSYVLPYIATQDGNANIVTTYNYTGDDWVFWSSLTIRVDDDTYTIPIGYNNVTRDNDNGLVWEYYDEVQNFSTPLDSERLQMLQKIANSQETIVRFEGKDFFYDLTVSVQDKTAIAETLALYSALIS